MTTSMNSAGLAALFITLAAPVAAQDISTVGRSYESRDNTVQNFRVNTSRGSAIAEDSGCDIRARIGNLTDAFSVLELDLDNSNGFICVIDDREGSNRLYGINSTHCSCDDRDDRDRGDRDAPDTPDTPDGPGESDSTGTGHDGGGTGGQDNGGPAGGDNGRGGGAAPGGPAR